MGPLQATPSNRRLTVDPADKFPITRIPRGFQAGEKDFLTFRSRGN